MWELDLILRELDDLSFELRNAPQNSDEWRAASARRDRLRKEAARLAAQSPPQESQLQLELERAHLVQRLRTLDAERINAAAHASETRWLVDPVKHAMELNEKIDTAAAGDRATVRARLEEIDAQLAQLHRLQP